MDLLTKIEHRRAALNLSDAEVARRLGISPPYWSQIRIGNRNVTVRVVRGIITGFPELAMDAWDWLRTPIADSSAENAPENSEAAS